MKIAFSSTSTFVVASLLTALWAESASAGGPGSALRQRYLSRCDGESLAFDGCVPDPNGLSVCVPKVVRDDVCEPSPTEAQCQFSKNDTITAQLRVIIDDEPCVSQGQQGAVVRAAMRVHRSDGAIYNTVEETLDLCDFFIPDCMSTDDPFFCAAEAGYLSESNPPAANWFPLRPVQFDLGPSNLTGVPVFVSATQLDAEDHAEDHLPTVLRFCVKISDFNLPTSCACDCEAYPNNCCSSVPDCCAYICSQECNEACALSPASCETYPSCSCPIYQFLSRPF